MLFRSAGTELRHADLLDLLLARIGDLRGDHPVRVGLDGRCGSGKSTLARDLVARLRADGVPATHLDSDGFHHVREHRRRRVDDPARGYYEDAYDLEALAERVLVPLGPGGDGVHATRVHDLDTDEVITDEAATAGPGAVVVFDCTFLQRGALRELWDLVVWLEVDREIALARGVARDAASLGGEDAARAAYESRYMAACDLYLAEERPAERADVVVGYDDPSAPVLLRDASSR